MPRKTKFWKINFFWACKQIFELWTFLKTLLTEKIPLESTPFRFPYNFYKPNICDSWKSETEYHKRDFAWKRKLVTVETETERKKETEVERNSERR